MMPHVEDFLLTLLTQHGEPYVFGAEVRPDDPDPEGGFDCSEIVQWGCAQVGVVPTMPDGSWIQARHCRNHGLEVDVATGIATRGALLFRFKGDPWSGGRPSSAHIAVSLGDGTTFEARGRKWGVGSWSVRNRGWTHAGLVPGLEYTPKTRLGSFVVDVFDPYGRSETPGRLPFWSIYSSGHVLPHNGARNFERGDMSGYDLQAPISGAKFTDWGTLVLSASGDSGTFELRPV